MFCFMESNRGYKVIYCPKGIPMGGRDSCNYCLIEDGLLYHEASQFVKRLNGPGPNWNICSNE